MLLLTATTDKISLITSAAVSCDISASYFDSSNADPPVVKGSTSGRQNTNVATATTTDIVAAPAGSTIRNVKAITVRNKDATSSNDVTIQYNQNGTLYELFKVTLLAGQTLEFIEGIGFFVVASTTKLDTKLMVTGDSVHPTAATWANVTGLQTAVVSGKKYGLECFLMHQTNATTTGAQFGIGGVAMTEMMIWGLAEITTSITAATYGSEAAKTAVDTAFVVETTGPGAVNMGAYFGGYFIPSATGTFSIRATSEVTVASGLIVKKGSWARIWEFDN